MSCPNCNSTLPVSIYDIQYLYNVNTCNSCNDAECGGSSTNAKCVYYSGPGLTCSAIETGDSFDVIIQKIDEQICAITGDYSGYNFGCIAEDITITTEQQFVEGISNFVCEFKDQYTTFVDTTFVTYQTTVDTRFDAIEVPGTTSCALINITAGDTIQTVLQKISNTICSINTTHLTLTGVNWDQCFTVAVEPTTVAEGFDLLIDQICSVKADLSTAGVTLPTFNNTTSCLATPGTTDSLVSTINKIKDRLCISPEFDINDLTWTCLTKPTTEATDLQSAFQAVLDALDDIKENLPTFDSGDFTVTATDGDDACAGKTVALATPLDVDRFVAVNGADTDPGTLVEKLTAGTNITLDVSTTPGTMIINSSAGASSDEKVKAFSADPDPSSYLDEKVEGDSADGITISTTNNITDGKVTFSPSIDWSVFIPALIEALEDDDDLRNQFCELISRCPSPCDPPTNIQAVAV